MKNKLHYYGDISTVWLFFKPIRVPRTVTLWKERLGDHKSNFNMQVMTKQVKRNKHKEAISRTLIGRN